MNSLSKIAGQTRPGYFDLRWRELLQNPLWYVTVVTFLAGLTIYLRFWWGLTGAVALVWGLWLIWQIFSDASQGDDAAEDDAQLRGWLVQALDYRTKIEQAVKYAETNNSPLCQPALISQIDGWVDVIQALTQRLELLRRDDLLLRDGATVPQIIKTLEEQLTQASDGPVRSQLEQALTYRRKQLAGLNHLQTTMQQAELQIESTLSLLSTVYAQILTGQSVSHVAASRHFLTDIDEEVSRLQDRLEALCEVKGWEQPGATSVCGQPSPYPRP